MTTKLCNLQINGSLKGEEGNVHIMENWCLDDRVVIDSHLVEKLLKK